MATAKICSSLSIEQTRKLAPYQNATALQVTSAVIGGMAWASIPAYLKNRFGTNEILTSLMLVYVIQLVLDWLVRGPWRDPQGYNFPKTIAFSGWQMLRNRRPAPSRQMPGTAGQLGAGAGIGLLFGAISGAAAGDASGYNVQRRYDNGYTQCMYAKGNQVPGFQPAQAYPPPPPPGRNAPAYPQPYPPPRQG